MNDSTSLFKQMLTAKRRSMRPSTRSRNKTFRKGSYKWNYPLNIEREYYSFISLLMKKFSAIAVLDIKSQYFSWSQEFKSDSYESDMENMNQSLRNAQLDLFDNYPEGDTARRIQQFGYSASIYNSKQFEKFIKIAVGEAFDPGDINTQSIINDWSSTNYELIKSLSDEYIKKVNVIVSDGVQFGETTKSITEKITSLNESITKNRAKLIARDQIGKINAVLTKKRQEYSDIEMYEWITSRDERVRTSHKAMEGSICRWDDATVYSLDSGKTWKKRPKEMQGLIPGQDIQCRCEAIPYIDYMIEEIDNQLYKEAA